MAEKDILEAMGARVSKRRVLLHIIGTRLRDHESGRSVPMLDCQPFCTWVVGVGFAEPSKEQRARCLAYWIKEPRAPSSFEWREGEQPKLKPDKPKQQNRKLHTEEND